MGHGAQPRPGPGPFSGVHHAGWIAKHTARKLTFLLHGVTFMDLEGQFRIPFHEQSFSRNSPQ